MLIALISEATGMAKKEEEFLWLGLRAGVIIKFPVLNIIINFF